MALPAAPVQAEAELDALRSELQQQQADLARRAASLAAAAKEGAAQVRLPFSPARCGCLRSRSRVCYPTC
jgi:multidrug resistance efflux pump